LTHIPFHILFYLFHPKLSVGLRERRSGTIVMAVPKTTVHKQRYLLSLKNRIRRPRQVFSVALELEPKLFK